MSEKTATSFHVASAISAAIPLIDALNSPADTEISGEDRAILAIAGLVSSIRLFDDVLARTRLYALPWRA